MQQVNPMGQVFKERVETKYGTCVLTLDFRNVCMSPPVVTSPPMAVIKPPIALNSAFQQRLGEVQLSPPSVQKPKIELEHTHTRLV